MTTESILAILNDPTKSNVEKAWRIQEEFNFEQHQWHSAKVSSEDELKQQIAARDKIIAQAEEAKSNPDKVAEIMTQVADIKLDERTRRRSKVQEMILAAQTELAQIDGKPVVKDDPIAVVVRPRISPKSIKE